MRHQKKTVKLGRTAEHRKALLANQVCSLIEHGRIKTTLAKAKAVRPFAEKMLTLGKKGSLHNRRTAIAYLRHPALVKRLFEEIAPRSANRAGGYTRIVKLGPRLSDSALMAYIEWVDAVVIPEDSGTTATPAAEPATAAPAPAPAPAAAATTTPTEPSKPKKKRETAARKTTDKAKRAETKVRKGKAADAPKAKLKSKAASVKAKAKASKSRKRS